MDSRILQEAALSYVAIYDDELREEMEECGMISDDDSYYVDEAREPGVKPYRPNPTQAEVRADAAAAAKRKSQASAGESGYGPDEKFKDWKDRSTPASTLKRKGGATETVSQRMNREKPYAKRMTGPMAREYGSRTAAATTRAIRGPGEPQAVTLPRKTQKESYDYYDVVLHHLISEGYADSVDSAEAIMANMSENWILDIVEEILDEDSRRISNKQHAERVRGHIQSFSGSKSIDYTPPGNWDPEANSGRGAILTRKQMEKQRRKNLRNSN